MRIRIARNRVALYVAAAVLAAAATFVPTPYSLMLPGRAIDLHDVVSVAGRAAPPPPFYLTDVRFAPRATAAELLTGLFPGVRIVRTQDVLPQGMTAVEYDGVEREAMSESQSIAAFVAEREAGWRVPVPRSRVLAVYFAPNAPAKNVLRSLDMFVSLNGHPIASNHDVQMALKHVKAGSNVRLAIMRHGKERILTVPTMRYGDRTALGAYLTTIYQRPQIPVAVSFHLPEVAGSSGGLMFALEIYRTLRHIPEHGARIAGTGTIAYDGSVGPIEGASQKVIAARNAGASVFLVPQDNYNEIAGTPGIRVVPVKDFRDALNAIGG
jgi:PDZ domain-containing protein